ncbi:archaetidylserine decarboxylase [Bradyrhizobium lablabi]|uniref:archaetidylserine decarboxylase n=1 Tax=Bradyrhizobium lablabi TaxID=722472 RepID=UPI001BA60C52|nr:archaetidylserine decarboxylase [Bradyrhizobium lablabi]MBR0697174.1 phosphatidylserine decarboxylase [Bradyrhizobium lablabi]
MTVKGLISAFTQQENLNFLLTNRIPRAALTRFMGWFSKVEIPLVRDASIACWRLFSDLDLTEAKKTEFKSLHDCFTRELKPGLRPADPDPSVITSPSDAIIGAHGRIQDAELFQVKGAPYSLLDLLGDPALVEQHRNGRFVTLRLTSSMYHRFHAPADLTIDKVTFIHGDVWNVNPIALKRIERLFCKNERAVLRAKLSGGEALTLVPVAAILVASIRLHFLDVTLNAKTRGPVDFACEAHVRKGDELGWFEHGSTIIVLAPDHFEFCDNVADGSRIKCGEPLLRKPLTAFSSEASAGSREEGASK